MIQFNSNSAQHLSILLFGGSLVDEEQVPVLDEDGNPKLYKSGLQQNEIKLKKVKKNRVFKGLGLTPLQEWKTKKEGIYQVNEAVLELITKLETEDSATGSAYSNNQVKFDAIQIAKLILEIRGLKKQISTYYKSTLECLDKNNIVHPSFNHTSTGTGRLSCSNPNVQNQPDKSISKVTQHFISRFVNGKLISADYSQLEIVVQAQLSGDKQFIQDVVDGVDFHVKRLALREHKTYQEVSEKVKESEEWQNKRKQVKGFSFARAYGAGVGKISSQTGLSALEVEELIAAEALEYPRLNWWCEFLRDEVNKQGYYEGFTGRRYNFKKYPPKFKWQTEDSYSPTEIKNYLIQGTATADIVLIMLGKFWRQKALFNRDKYLLINTIHDSVMLDCREEFVTNAKKDLQVLDRVKLMCHNEFNYDWVVPIKIGISGGISWYEL